VSETRPLNSDLEYFPLHPLGATCADCVHYTRTCSWLISYSGQEVQCDWSPSKFRARAVKDTATP
jgi:hypothetical protein